MISILVKLLNLKSSVGMTFLDFNFLVAFHLLLLANYEVDTS